MNTRIDDPQFAQSELLLDVFRDLGSRRGRQSQHWRRSNRFDR